MENTQKFEVLEKVAKDYSSLEGSMVYAHLSSEIDARVSELAVTTLKVDGAMFVALTKGSLRMNYNCEDYIVTAPAIITFEYGAVVSFNTSDMTTIEAYMMALTPSFMQDVNISFAAISNHALVRKKRPYVELSDAEMSKILRYLHLMHSVLVDNFNTQLTRHIMSSLTAALFYQMFLFLYTRIEADNFTPESASGGGQRRNSYVHDFMKLVHLHYTRERSVQYYADCLFISPKYLSLLVKEATGTSAARWIDRFVIAEAKNLLRYSGKNIQQVAYALNFSNQSAFGKYFKHLTGMSPTEFQKS